MKNKLLIILVIIILISGILAGISFLLLDRENVKEYYGDSFGINIDSWGNGMGHMVRSVVRKEFDRNMKLKHYQDLDEFNRVEIKDLEGTVRFYDGDDIYNRIEIYSHNKNKNWNGIEEFKIREGVLKIHDLKQKGNIIIDIYSKNLSGLEVEIGEIEGVLEINETLKNLKIDSIEGVFKIEASESFDIDVDSSEGVTEINFQENNAKIMIDETQVIGNVYKQELVDFNGKRFEATSGDERHKIKFDELSGVANIE